MGSDDEDTRQPAQGSPRASEAGEEAAKAVPLLALDSQDLLGWFIGVLASRAWVDMGLLTDPVTGEAAKRLESARLAIDALEGLSRVLKGRIPPEEARRIAGLLADLRLNFVRQAG